MTILRLQDMGTREVLSRFRLTTDRRVGKGWFCAVYEDGLDAVTKLTADAIQLESVRHYLVGNHFPKLLQATGRVGTQHAGNLGLYLFQAERLRPVKDADAATQKLARKVVGDLGRARAKYHRDTMHLNRIVPDSWAQRCNADDAMLLGLMLENKAFPGSVREAFGALLSLVSTDKNLVLDFKSANFMVRGTDELVFNDVIANGALYPRYS